MQQILRAPPSAHQTAGRGASAASGAQRPQYTRPWLHTATHAQYSIPHDGAPTAYHHATDITCSDSLASKSTSSSGHAFRLLAKQPMQFGERPIG
jgi:hypothetical protein